MVAEVKGRLRRSFEPWPGYVDVLSTLLMVIIFVLLIFVIAQFFLSDAISGRDEALDKLTRQVDELSEILALERKTSEGLRTSITDLSGELQSSVSQRDSLERQLKTAIEERNAMAASLAQSQAALAQLQEGQLALEARIAEGNELVAARDSLNQRLTTVIAERDALALRLSQTESRLADISAALALKSEEAARLAAERKRLSEQLAALSGERDTLAGRLNTTEGELAQTQSALSQTQERATTAETELRQTHDTLAATQDTLAATQATLEEITARLATTESRLAETEGRLAQSQSRLADTERQLAEALSRITALQAAIADADVAVRDEREERAQVEARLEDAYRQIEADSAKVQALLRDIDVLESLRRELEDKVLATQQQAEEDIAAQREISTEAQRQVALLNAQLLSVRQRLAELELVLGERQTTIESQKIEIAELGKKLNAALISKVQELERYRSEFFGRLREVLGSRQDVQVVGDRFVFQSEVLFDTGSAEIGDGGKVQLAQFAQTLNEIAGKIPPDVDWLLRVDGHTDNRPINKPEFPSNWELSAARAIAVVKFLESQGIPATRLAATGFGEFRPIATGEDEDSLRKNRRIELKLDQR